MAFRREKGAKKFFFDSRHLHPLPASGVAASEIALIENTREPLDGIFFGSRQVNRNETILSYKWLLAERGYLCATIWNRWDFPIVEAVGKR